MRFQTTKTRREWSVYEKLLEAVKSCLDRKATRVEAPMLWDGNTAGRIVGVLEKKLKVG